MTTIVTTDRTIDLGQLDAEIAAVAGLPTPPGLTASAIGSETTVRCDHPAVTQTILDDAIDAHVPAPPPPSVEANLQAQIDELADMMMGA